jgi:hypothetical protein
VLLQTGGQYPHSTQVSLGQPSIQETSAHPTEKHTCATLRHAGGCGDRERIPEPIRYRLRNRKIGVTTQCQQPSQLGADHCRGRPVGQLHPQHVTLTVWAVDSEGGVPSVQANQTAHRDLIGLER